MKKILLSIVFLLTSCAIEGEVFRLQTRINYWYDLLTPEATMMFAQNQISELGEWLDQQEQKNEAFQTQLRLLRQNEAIMSFDGVQTTHFFYHVLLKDLSKFSYAEFMDVLTPQEKIDFINKTNFTSNPYTKAKNVLEKATKQYGFHSFSDNHILTYYRNLSFVANYYVIVYDTLALLARYRVFEQFLSGDLQGSLRFVDLMDKNIKSTRIQIRTQAKKDKEYWLNLKKRVYLSDLSDLEFLQVLYQVLPQMNQNVYEQTLNNIRQRYEEK